jgi:phosphotriesterase-related protein
MPNIVRTVLGDIPSEQLGVTYMHEHLIIDSPIVSRDFSHIHLPSESEAIAEVVLCRSAGVQTMVDCMPTGSGRSAIKLAAISKATGINIVATAGLHTDRYYLPTDQLETMDSEHLAQVFVKDIEIGMEGTEFRAGQLKVVTSGSVIKDRDRRLFEAVAIAHQITGAPIVSHCEHGTGALEQIELFTKLRIPVEKVTLSHTDKENDFGYHREILSSGINVEYDQSLRQSDQDTPPSALLMKAMIDEGFIGQIMLGTDGARRSLWSSLGGSPGLAWLFTGWSQRLLKLGLTQAQLNKIFIDNPARTLALDVNTSDKSRGIS